MMGVRLRRLGPNYKIHILKVQKEGMTQNWMAGRGTKCHMYTKSIYASRQHFSITYRDKKFFISDLQSSNGTFLNDEKLINEKMLNIGDIISVGVPSEMQNSPDCIVFIFETHPEKSPEEKQLDICKNDEVCDILGKNTSGFESPLISLEKEDPTLSEVRKATENVIKKNDSIETFLNDNSSNDVELIEPSGSINCSVSAQIIKQEEIDVMATAKSESNEKRSYDGFVKDEDIFAYEVPTQIEESQIKEEYDVMNYSVTEELIEISDSEDDWAFKMVNITKREHCKSPETDEDDDVIILETKIKSELIKNDLVDSDRKVCAEMTNINDKYIGKFFSEEKGFFKIEEVIEITEEEDHQKEATEVPEMITDEPENEEPIEKSSEVDPCTLRLTKLSTQDDFNSIPVKPFSSAEVPQKIIDGVVARKSVSFDLIPQINYYEVPFRPRLSVSEKGRMRFKRIIFNICNWNTHWLEECKRVAPEKDPPDICEERLRKIPKNFPSHSDYMIAFIPAMLLNLWNKIKSKWINSGASAFKQTVSCDSLEDINSRKMTVFNCTGLAQNVSAHKQLIREGHLVLLRLHQVQNPQSVTPATEKYAKKLGYLVFGFVESRIYERFHHQPMHPSLAERCASIRGDLHIVRLSILVKKRPSFQVDQQKLIQLTVVHQISQEIKMFKGICFLPDSPLCKAILKPMKNELPLVEPVVKENLAFKGPIDDFQSDIVRKLSHAMSFTSSLLFNIHGAAGTGKGQVIMGLIVQLLYGDEWKGKRPKILYCTQWSAPLDEMVVKLKNYSETMDEPFSLVRVGSVKEVKPEVKSLCLSNLGSILRNKNKKYCLDEKNFDAEIEVIKESNVICATCNSAGISKMCIAFEKLVANDKNLKVICIIDEAMSCKEPNSVIPLLLGVTHLLLVGDIYQLEPSFSGEKTHSLGFDCSLFQRIYKNFFNVPKELCPIYTMKTQYRMTNNLLNFTSKIIYDTQLQNATVNISHKIESIKSHLLFVDQTLENLEKEEKTIRELDIVSQLIRVATKVTKRAVQIPVRFAVITCDTKETESLQSLLPKREYPEVEIDSIQAFQGREFDVVVFYYNGNKIPNSWIATALTRARSNLFIFTSEHSINENHLFLKVAEEAEKHGFLKYVHPNMSFKQWEQVVKEENDEDQNDKILKEINGKRGREDFQRRETRRRTK